MTHSGHCGDTARRQAIISDISGQGIGNAQSFHQFRSTLCSYLRLGRGRRKVRDFSGESWDAHFI